MAAQSIDARLLRPLERRHQAFALPQPLHHRWPSRACRRTPLVSLGVAGGGNLVGARCCKAAAPPRVGRLSATRRRRQKKNGSTRRGQKRNWRIVSHWCTEECELQPGPGGSTHTLAGKGAP